jgi:biopolymer transport protein ExbD
LANWDIFHADRLELERNLATSAIRDALARGELRDDDLVRPAGTSVAWSRVADIPELLETASGSPEPHIEVSASQTDSSSAAHSEAFASELSIFELDPDEPSEILERSPVADPSRPSDWLDEDRSSEADDVTFPVIKDAPSRSPESKSDDESSSEGWTWALAPDADNIEEVDADFDGAPEILEAHGADDLEILDDVQEARADVPFVLVDEPSPKSDSSALALPVISTSDLDEAGALAEIPEEDQFSLTRSGPMTVEELDLAPMVDVAFQLVLFFMVAAQTILYKTLEIPKPSPEQAPAAVAQGRSKSLDELKEDYILVEIDGSGTMKIDREPVASEMGSLVERLRSARETTHRKAMLLSAEYATSHRNAVLAYDAANEIGLGIVIARPAAPQGPAPGLVPAGNKAPAVPPAGAGGVPN